MRQNYNRVAPRLAAQIGRYAHAKQFKRMRRLCAQCAPVWALCTARCSANLHMLPDGAKAKVQDLLNRTGRILTQRTKDKNKLYALHAPEVECISKGKARTPYEFGVKVSIATTLKEGLVVGMRSMPGNPYDGHTLAETLEQVGILTGISRQPRPSWTRAIGAWRSTACASCARGNGAASPRRSASDSGRAAVLLHPIRSVDAGAHRGTAGRSR